MPRVWSATFSLLIVIAVSVSAQTVPESLRELVKAYARDRPGEPLVLLGPVGDYSPKTVAELTQEAELVAVGRLSKRHSYVGRDERRILTDYAIQDLRVLAGRSETVLAQAAATPSVLTLLGGEITIDGVQVRGAPTDDLVVRNGGEYLMFLRPSRGGGTGRYEPYHGGIFAIDVGVIRPPLRNGDIIFKDAFDASLPIVMGQIEAAAKVRPKK